MIRATTQQQPRPLPSDELDAIAERLARLHPTRRGLDPPPPRARIIAEPHQAGAHPL
jgi:hypothetical protein